MQRPNGEGYFTETQRNAALMYVATTGAGQSIARCARELAISNDSLKRMTVVHRDLLDEMREKYGPDLEARAVMGLKDFLVASEEVKAQALSRVSETIDEADIKDSSNALKSVSIAQGIAVQKVLELTGRPTQIVAHENMASIMARLRSLGAEVIEGTAVDVVDSSAPTQLVAGEPAPDSI